MALTENNEVRTKITDKDGDSVFVFDPDPDGSVVVTTHSAGLAEEDAYTAVALTRTERLALADRLLPELRELATELRREADAVDPHENGHSVDEPWDSSEQEAAYDVAISLRETASRVTRLIQS